MQQRPTTKVYYNSACPVCDSGIAAQKSKMQACQVEWIDVHANPGAVQALGTGLEAVRERLHVQDEAGHIAIGAPALALLWGQTPGQGFWGRVANWPFVAAPFGLAYNVFAKLLYRWNRWKKHW